MSVELVLIPIGIAAVAARRMARASSLCERCRATIVADRTLVVEALTVLDWQILDQGNEFVCARTPWGPSLFRQIGEVYLARVDGASDEVTLEMIKVFDAAAGRIAQMRGVQRAMQQATEMGLRLIEQRDEGGQVRLVFEEA
ncbi:hypothetical protein [Agrococcus lahaulensis]|uniref:hypothetical protein n=1 Tax=Agrococcus lahaulensis TaxID=341722 RepID=UPI00047D800D|nr:hypothetical protein [Agrococcus lahaulensis]